MLTGHTVTDHAQFGKVNGHSSRTHATESDAVGRSYTGTFVDLTPDSLTRTADENSLDKRVPPARM